MGWCDDSKSKFYNKKIEFPFKYNAEKLYKRSNVYDLIIVINYNMRMTKKTREVPFFYIQQTGNIIVLKDVLLFQKRI